MTDKRYPAGPKRRRLGADRRLKKTVEFNRVFKGQYCTADSQLIVYGRANRRSHSRIGISAGKRLGSAVRRNRYKRTLREAFRLSQFELPVGYDFVLIPRRAEKVSTQRYRKSLLQLCRKVHQHSRCDE